MPHSSSKWIAVVLTLAAGALLLFTRPWAGPYSADALRAYTEGNSKLSRFQYQGALDAYTSALELEPGFAMASLQRATCVWRSRGRSDAAEFFAEAESLSAHGANACERLWIRYRAAEFRGDESTRASAYRQLRSEFPKDPFTLELEAEHAQKAGDLQLAIERFEAVVSERPQRVDLLNKLGYLALEAGRYDQAIAHLKRYAFYAPDAANPHDSLGEILLATGSYFESIQEYLEALAIDPTFSSSLIGASDGLLITGQLQRAENLLRTAHDQLEAEGRLPRFHLSQTQILFARGQWGQLIAEVDRRVRRPEFDEAEAIGPALWMRALQCLASTRQGEHQLARTQRDSLLAQTSALKVALPERAAEWRTVLGLMESTVQAAYGVRFGEKPIQRLAQLRSEIDAAPLPPYQLLSFRTLLSQALFDHGLYEEALEVCEANLRWHAAHPRSNLLAAQSLAELGRDQEAFARVSVCLNALQYADPGIPILNDARRLRDRLEPPSS